MKIINKLLVGLLFCPLATYSQTIQNAGGAGSTSTSYWSRSGNEENNSNNNSFGTRWNSPIYFVTGGIGSASTRMKLNANFTSLPTQYEINGFNWNNGVNTTGYLLLGRRNISMVTSEDIYNVKGAFSMFHLNGVGSVYQEYGYRPWMQTGITLTSNKDLSYFGHRKLSTDPAEEDITETVFLWSDNISSNDGPDNLVFRFSGFGGSDKFAVSNNRLSSTDLDGLTVALFGGNGFMGLGNTFGTNATGMNLANYVNPMSILHTSYDFRLGATFNGYGFHQITYRNDGSNNTLIGTGETENDGLRWGISNTLSPQNFLSAYLRWQENSPIIFQTDWDNTPGGINQGERMRILTTGTPGMPAATLMPTNENVTRIAMSYLGSNPILLARTLLHLGSDNANVSDWMEYGAMVANSNSAVFLGITPTNYSDPNVNTIGTNNSDLIVLGNAGEIARFDNQNRRLGVGDFGPNGLNVEPQQRIDVDGNGRFRVVPANGGQSIILGIEQSGPDDIILSRLEFPNDETLVLQGDGTWGVAGAQGEQGPQGIQGEQGPIGLTGPQGPAGANGLDGAPGPIGPQGPAGNDGAQGPQGLQGLTGPIGPQGPAGAQGPIGLTGPQGPAGANGLDGAPGPIGPQGPPGEVVLSCDQGGTTLLNDSQFNLNNNNLFFSFNEELNKNHVGIGYDCDNALPGKLSVIQTHPNPVTESTTTIHALNEDVSELPNTEFTAVFGHTYGSHDPSFFIRNRGGDFFASNAAYNNAVFGYSLFGDNTSSGNDAGLFRAFGGKMSRGVVANGEGAEAGLNVGVWCGANSPYSTTLGGVAYGVHSLATGGDVTYGIYAEAAYATIDNYAGYFNGDLVYTMGNFQVSDSTLKTNITTESNILPYLVKLRPVNYEMNPSAVPSMHMSQGLQHGFLSQEVQVLFPEIVKPIHHPAVYDSLGNVVTPGTTILGMDYTKIIPLNTQAIIELNRDVQNATLSDVALKNNIVDLDNSLEKILALHGVTYKWNTGAIDSLQLDNKTHIGFISQEVYDVDSLLTFEGQEGFLHVDYERVVPVIVEAMQEMNDIVVQQNDSIQILNNVVNTQQGQIDDLNDRLTHLENCLSGILPFLCYLNNSMIEPTQEEVQQQLKNHIEVVLEDTETVILSQNVPNPFAETTTINFTVPQAVQKAQIHFYDAQGKLIKTVDLKERGEGSITVFASDLSTGVYTYTLIADGAHIATKRMVKE